MVHFNWIKIAILTRGTGTRVGWATKIPNFQMFLRVKENLCELQDLLVEHFKEFENGDKISMNTSF